MDRNYAQQIPVGTDVLGSDGGKVGTVSAADANAIVVEKGFFFPTDYTIPTSAIATFDGDAVYLNVTKDGALNTDWGRGATTVLGAAAEAEYDTTMTDTTMTGNVGYTDTQRTNVTDQDHLVVPVHEEELVATTRQREAGEVQITKNVVEETRTLEVPITEERVQVTRRAVDRDATVGDDAFRGETIEVPLTTEEVELQKRVRVAEEVAIDREQVQTTQSVQGTVRREVVDVNETTAVETGSRSYTDTDVGTTGTDVVTDTESKSRKRRKNS